MRQTFDELPPKRQLQIVNAAMEVFGKNSYKHASTEEIAYRAGISKGLLFYYFKSKQALYEYVYHYCDKQVQQTVAANLQQGCDDFFELMDRGANAKADLIRRHPAIMDFMMRVWAEQGQQHAEQITSQLQEAVRQNYGQYFAGVRLDRFRDDVDPLRLHRMLLFMVQGYVAEMQRLGLAPDVDEMMAEWHCWLRDLRRLTYKEEYQ